MKDTAIIIRHELPGRIRFTIRGGARESVHRFGALKEMGGVLWLRVNDKCASLVVGYDPEVVARGALLSAVLRAYSLEKERSATLLAPRKTRSKMSCACSGSSKGAVPKAARRFAAISAIMGVTFIRTTILGGAVAQTACSPLGLFALAFSLPLIRSGIRKLKTKRVDLDGFLGAGTIAAVAAGEALTAFEILWINSGAELLTAWTAERSRKSISKILEITSHHTFVLQDGVEVEREVRDVRFGDTVVLHTGEKVSVDGAIIDGEALLNEAPITGRRELSHKAAGDMVYAGTFVREGVIRVKASHVGDRTYLARVMRQVQDELENRAPIEGVADRLAASLVKIGMGVTVLTFLITGSAWRAFTVLLVMACPCATSLAASTAVSASIGAAARNRILIKGGRYLEEAGQCDVVCFDKTGTLTTHEPILLEIAPAEGVGKRELLRLACSAEAHNHHPLAQAIKAEAKRQGVSPVPHTVCDYRMGMGIMAEINGEEVLVGSLKLANEYGIATPACSNELEGFRARGLTVLHVFKNKEAQGVLCLDAKVRPEAGNVIHRLQQMGVKRTMIITGDEESSASRLANDLGLGEYHASIMPADKAKIVSRIMADGHKILMVGDGVNDTLALARADVGVAIGAGGAEAAVESADITLADDSLEALADVYGLSRWTMRVVRQNFWIATGSNIVGVALGATGLLSPVAAGLIHIAHTLGVVANSSRLLTFSTKNTRKELSGKGEADGFKRNGGATTPPGDQAPYTREVKTQISRRGHKGSAGDAIGEGAAGHVSRPQKRTV